MTSSQRTMPQLDRNTSARIQKKAPANRFDAASFVAQKHKKGNSKTETSAKAMKTVSTNFHEHDKFKSRTRDIIDGTTTDLIKTQMTNRTKTPLVSARITSKDRRSSNANQNSNKFEELKQQYKNLELPPKWVGGIINNRLAFNRIVVSLKNLMYDMGTERGLLICNDCSVHVMFKGHEVILDNWDIQKVETANDILKAIKLLDGLKFGPGSAGKTNNRAPAEECKTCQNIKCAPKKKEHSSKTRERNMLKAF